MAPTRTVDAWEGGIGCEHPAGVPTGVGQPASQDAAADSVAVPDW